MTLLINALLVCTMFLMCISSIQFVLTVPFRDLRFPVGRFLAITLSCGLLFLIGV